MILSANNSYCFKDDHHLNQTFFLYIVFFFLCINGFKDYPIFIILYICPNVFLCNLYRFLYVCPYVFNNSLNQTWSNFCYVQMVLWHDFDYVLVCVFIWTVHNFSLLDFKDEHQVILWVYKINITLTKFFFWQYAFICIPLMHPLCRQVATMRQCSSMRYVSSKPVSIFNPLMNRTLLWWGNSSKGGIGWHSTVYICSMSN